MRRGARLARQLVALCTALLVTLLVGICPVADGFAGISAPAGLHGEEIYRYDSPSTSTTPTATACLDASDARPGLRTSPGAVRLVSGCRLATKVADDLPVGVGRGPHAGESIPARGTARDFTAAEREAIDDIGADGLPYLRDPNTWDEERAFRA